MTKIRFILPVFIILFGGCGKTEHNKTGVEAAMQQYNRLIQKMDADSIALLYAPDGSLGSMAHGRDSIRAFLASFKNVTVLSNSSESDSIHITGDTAFQWGRYRQVAVIDGKDTARLRGVFHARWIWAGREGWQIRQMLTTPEQ